jgi:hypothetical protein
MMNDVKINAYENIEERSISLSSSQPRHKHYVPL